MYNKEPLGRPDSLALVAKPATKTLCEHGDDLNHHDRHTDHSALLGDEVRGMLSDGCLNFFDRRVHEADRTLSLIHISEPTRPY